MKPLEKLSAHRAGVLAAKWPVLRFVGLFAVVLAAFYGFSATPWFQHDLFPAYLRLNAQVSAAILRLLGEDAHATGISIASSRFGLEIKRGCDATEPCFLLIAAVLAFPAPWKSKFAPIMLGPTVLLLLNLLRIVSLYYAGVYWPGAFEFIHVDVWQTLFLCITMLLWIVWAWRVINHHRIKNTNEPQ